MTAIPTGFGSLGTIQDIHLEPTRPYNTFISNRAGNSGNEPPYHKRIRIDNPDYNDDEWTPRYGAQKGRIWLHPSNVFPFSGDAPAPYTNYNIYVKGGVFHRLHRNHQDQTYFDRHQTIFYNGDEYGYGVCRGKELNGQILISDPVLYKDDRPHEFRSNASTDTDDLDPGCRAAHDNRVDTYYACDPPVIGFLGYRLGKDNTDVHWDTFLRIQVNVPVGSTIVGARMTLYTAGSGSTKARLKLLDVDDCPDFDSTAATTHGTLNPLTETDADLLEVSASEAGPVPFGVELKEFLQAFVDRPGYSPGNWMGVKLMSDSTNATSEEIRIHFLPEVPIMRFSLIYREPGYDPHTPPAKPPQLNFYERWDMERQYPIVEGPEMGEWPADGTYGILHAAWNKIADYRLAAEYRYLWFLPVPPISSWYDEEVHGGSPPYGSTAHQAPYPFNECGTYEIPCTLRHSTPYRYQKLGQNSPWVAQGLRACVGHADRSPRPATEPIYMAGCVGYENASVGLAESLIHQYHARTATVKNWFNQSKGWYISYTIYVKAWMAIGDETSFLRLFIPGNDPDNYGPILHWNCWYEMEIVAKYNGPNQETDVANWEQFKSWVNSHENAFGGTITPKAINDNLCNDALLKCAGVNCAMGDVVRPPEAVQEDDCEDLFVTGQKLPCVNDGRISRWYLPFLGSNHPFTPEAGPVIPQMPEYGLFHEFERKVRTDPAGSLDRTDTGWMQVGFQTNMPVISGADAIDTFPKNHIIQMTPFKPLTGDPSPDPGAQVDYKWTDVDNVIGAGAGLEYFVSITDGMSEAAIESAFESMIGLGTQVVEATKTGTAPDVFLLEFIGPLAQVKVDLVVTYYYAETDGDFESEVLDVQNPTGGGIPGP